MSWIVRDVKRLVGEPDWTIIGAVVLCWTIYAIPVGYGIALEYALPRHFVPG